MSYENEPPTPDPVALWNAWYAANIEAWSQGMANLVASDVFSQAMAQFLDHYFTTSASLQKLVDYHMGAWLTTLNMPTREDLSRLERQLLRAEFPLDELQAKIDQMAQQFDQQQPPPAAASSPSDKIANLETRLQSLEDRTREMLDMLRSLQADVRATSAALAAARSPRSKGGGAVAEEHNTPAGGG